MPELQRGCVWGLEAWVSGTGEYGLSNDPGYDPNVGSTVTWQRMPKK